jgi:hypothetical protein
MREDSDVDYVFAAMVVFLYAQEFVSAFGRGPDDLSWERRWWGLDSTRRERIADASYSNSRLAELEDPEEAQLAKGYRRRQNRRGAYRGLAVFPIFVILAALMLCGVIQAGVFGMIFAVVIYGVERPTVRRVKEARRRIRPLTTEPDTAQ